MISCGQRKGREWSGMVEMVWIVWFGSSNKLDKFMAKIKTINRKEKRVCSFISAEHFVDG